MDKDACFWNMLGCSTSTLLGGTKDGRNCGPEILDFSPDIYHVKTRANLVQIRLGDVNR